MNIFKKSITWTIISFVFGAISLTFGIIGLISVTDHVFWCKMRAYQLSFLALQILCYFINDIVFNKYENHT